MTWLQRLKRVFNIDIETCCECGGAVRVIACIEDYQVIKKILDHLMDKAGTAAHTLLARLFVQDSNQHLFRISTHALLKIDH